MHDNDRCQTCNHARRAHVSDGCAAYDADGDCECSHFVAKPKAGDVCAGCHKPITAAEVRDCFTVRPGVVCRMVPCGLKAMRARAAELGRAVTIRDCFTD